MVVLHPDEALPPFRHPWRKGVAVGRAYELIRADAQRHLAFVAENLRFEYCRFHGLFHDDMAVAVRQESGEIAYQWNHVDKVFDFLRSVGMRPFVELGPMPGALASGPTTFFHWRMNVTPPARWEEWGHLVESFVWHCVDRYGIDEVRRWYFEVWNEPNLDAFWTGSMEDYWKLYETAARAIKGVDSQLRVGGPASAEAGWIPEFLDFTASTGTPVDFVSTHAYPQNEFARWETRAESPFEPGSYFVDTVREVGRKVQERGLEIHWTEWSALDASGKADVDWYANETIDSIHGAALVCDVCTRCDELADSLFWWVASDVFEEMGMPQSPFANSFGMVTVDGIPKSSFHAFRFLSLLRGDRIQVSATGPHPNCRAAACRDGRVLRVLLWNHVPPGTSCQTWSDSLHWDGEGIATLRQIRPGAGSAYETWVSLGRPQNPTPMQTEGISAASEPETRFQTTPGAIDFELGPGEVLLIELAPPPDPYVLKGTDGSATALWNEALSDVATP